MKLQWPYMSDSSDFRDILQQYKIDYPNWDFKTLLENNIEINFCEWWD
jgi:hypothetical protein